MLKADIVDCENWDVFSVIKGHHKMSPEEREAAEMATPAGRKARAAAQDDAKRLAHEQIPQLIAAGQADLAIKAHQRMLRDLPGWSLAEPELGSLILALHKQKLWTESFPVIREYLSQCPEKAAVMRLRLARVFAVELNRPIQALKVLDSIDEAVLNAREKEFSQKLRVIAEQLRRKNDNEYEMLEEW